MKNRFDEVHRKKEINHNIDRKSKKNSKNPTKNDFNANPLFGKYLWNR